MISRYFGTVRRLAHDGGVIVARLDELGEVYVSPREAARAGVALQPGDKIEMQIVRGRDVALATYSGELA